MLFTKLTNLSPGAPTLVNANGSLTNVLRWALPQLGWAIEFGPTGNAAVFRAPAGNRFRFCINNNAGANGYALTRGAETATSATAWASLFPLSAQVPNTNAVWLAGDPNNPGVGSEYVIYVNDRCFYYFCKYNTYSSDPYWGIHFFGDVPSRYSTGFETVMMSNNVGGYGDPAFIMDALSPYPEAGYPALTWCRGINGTTKGTMGRAAGTPSQICATTNAPVVRGGYLNRLVREKIGIHCTGNASLYGIPNTFQIPYRGWLPNLWNPLHNRNNGALSDQDTFTDTDYNPNAVFRWYAFEGNGRGIIFEETDTWSLP